MLGKMHKKLGFIKNASGINSKEAAANVTRLLKKGKKLQHIAVLCKVGHHNIIRDLGAQFWGAWCKQKISLKSYVLSQIHIKFAS